MERKAYPLPVKAELPVKAVRYSDVRSRVEIASEITPIVNFRNADIKVLYEDLGMSTSSVAKAVGLSKSYTGRLLRERGTEMRSAFDQSYVMRRADGVRRMYADPVKKAAAMAKRETPEIIAKRSKILQDKYRADSKYKDLVLEMGRRGRVAKRKADEVRRMQRVDQINEQMRLKREEESQYAQTLRDNPAFDALSPRQRQVIELRFRTDGGLALTLEQVGEVMGGITRQAVQQYETAALVKLGILRKYSRRSSRQKGA